MVDEILRAYICPQALAGPVHFESLESLRSVTSVDPEGGNEEGTKGLVSTKIEPLILEQGCRRADVDGEFKAFIVPDPIGSCQPECWFYGETSGPTFIRWDRGEFDVHPIIEVTNPDHCQWYRTEVKLKGPVRCGDAGCELIIISSDPEGSPGIPDSKRDAHGGGSVTEFTQVQNTIVPGMRLQVEHYFFDGILNAKVDKDHTYWCTPCFTGGKITAKVGEYNDEDLYFTVLVEGEYVKCFPLDWVQWEVGDWVYLVPISPSSTCQDPTRDHGSKACGGGPGQEYSILPIKVYIDGD